MGSGAIAAGAGPVTIALSGSPRRQPVMLPHRGAWWAVFPIMLITLIPVLVVFSAWLAPENEIFAHLREHQLPRLLENTFWLLLGVGIGVTLLGVSLAWLIALCEFPGRRQFAWLLLLPMAMPAYVTAFAWLGLFDITGVVPTWLRTQLGVQSFPTWGARGGVIFVMTLALYPYVYFIARSAFRQQGLDLVNVARSLGVGRWHAFRRVALPMAWPAIAAGVLLALMETLADFGTMAVFNYDTFTTAIYQAWFALFSLPAASQLASILVLLVMCLLVLERALRRRKRYARERPASAGGSIRLDGSRGVAASLYCALVFCIGFLVPFAQLSHWAWARGLRDLDARYWSFAWHSFSLAAMGCLLVTALALVLSYARRMHPTLALSTAVRFAGSGYALPGTVLAVGVYIPLAALDRWLTGALDAVFGWQVDTVLQGTIWVMLCAFTARFLAVSLGPVEAGLGRVPVSVDEAAQSLGAGAWQRVRRLHVPLLRGSLLTAMALVFVDIMKELPITLMTRPFGWDTLSVRVFEMTSEGEWERAALPAVLIVLVGILPVILLTRSSDHAAS